MVVRHAPLTGPETKQEGEKKDSGEGKRTGNGGAADARHTNEGEYGQLEHKPAEHYKRARVAKETISTQGGIGH